MENNNVLKIQNKSINLGNVQCKSQNKISENNWHVQKRTTGNNLKKYKQIYF